MGVVLMLKWQLICHQKSEFVLLTLYQLSFWNHNSYHVAKRKQLTQIYLPYNQFLLPYKRSIFTIKATKMILFLEISTLYPDLPYKQLPYKWSKLYRGSRWSVLISERRFLCHVDLPPIEKTPQMWGYVAPGRVACLSGFRSWPASLEASKAEREGA